MSGSTSCATHSRYTKGLGVPRVAGLATCLNTFITLAPTFPPNDEPQVSFLAP